MKTPLASLLFLLVLGSCAMQEIPEKLIPSEANRFAITYIDTLRKGNIAYCHDKLNAELQGETAINTLASIHDSLKWKQVKNSRIINCNWTTQLNSTKTTRYHLEYEYEYTDSSWIYHSFNLLEENKNFTVRSFNIYPHQQSLSQIHEFSLNDKTVLHYLWLFLSATILLFILTTFLYAIFQPIEKKWFWLLIILLGIGQFTLNWTTGEYTFQTLAFQLLGVGMRKSGLVAPWLFTFSVPAGAILFWIIRFQNRKTDSKSLSIQAAYETAPNN